MKLTHPEEGFLSFAAHWQGWTYYEPVTTLLFIELFKEKKTFYDIGANIGYFSLIAALVNPDLHVTSFEPHPKLHPILLENIQVNNLGIVHQPIAVSDEVGEQQFFITKSDMSGSLVDGFRETLDKVTVPSTSVDHYVKQNPPNKSLLVKIDVEGHEPSVFKGAQKAFAEYRPDLITEVIEPYDHKIHRFFRDLGYEFYLVGPGGLEHRENVEHHEDKKYSNYLLTNRASDEVSALNERAKPGIDRLSSEVLTKASCY